MSRTTVPQGLTTAQSLTLFAAEDDRRHVRYTEDAVTGDLLRVHYRVSRLTGNPGHYTYRHFCDATEADRRAAEAQAPLPHDLDRLFAGWKQVGCLFRARYGGDRRRWVEYVLLGSPVDDPLVQLELEMMLDLSSGVSA